MTAIRTTSVTIANTGDTTITVNDGIDFSEVVPSSSIQIDGIAANLIVDSGTEPVGGVSTLTLRTGYPAGLALPTGYAATITIGSNAFKNMANELKTQVDYVATNIKTVSDYGTTNNSSFPWPSIDGTTTNVKTPLALESELHLSPVFTGSFTAKTSFDNTFFVRDYDANGGGAVAHYVQLGALDGTAPTASARMTTVADFGGTGTGTLTFDVLNAGTMETALSFTSAKDATFNGDVTVNPSSGGNGQVDVSRTAGATVRTVAQSATGQIGTSSNHNLQLITNGTARITIDTAGDSTFSGDVEIPNGDFYLSRSFLGTPAAIAGITTSDVTILGAVYAGASTSIRCAAGEAINIDASGNTYIDGNVGIGAAPLSNVDLYVVGSAADDAMRIFQNTAASIAHIAFVNSNGTAGSITTSGTATAYNTSSDPRLKDFKALPTDEEINTKFDSLYGSFRVFDWKNGSASDVWGFDAHACVDAGLDMGAEGRGGRDLEIGEVYETETIPEVTETITKQVQQTVTKTRETTTIEVVDGVPTQVVRTEEYEEPVSKEIGVVDEQGQPVTQLVDSGEFEDIVVGQDEDGIDIIEQQPIMVEQQITHSIPVMVEVTETVVTQEAQTIEKTVSPAGVDQSKAVPILLAKIEQLERRLKTLESV